MFKAQIYTAAFSAAISCLVANAAEAQHESKRLTDWFDAEWFDNMVKIPLSIDDSPIWYLNSIPCLTENCATSVAGGKCYLDNNNPYTVFYA